MPDEYAEICPYCGNLFSKHTKLRHIEKCFLRPENGELLAKFLLRGLDNKNNISWTNTYKFAKLHRISTSSTISSQTDSDRWETAIIRLILLFYEHEIIDDFELYDLIIGKLTLWSYFEDNQFELAKHKYLTEYKSIDVIDSIPYVNFEKLLMAIISRAVFDYQFLKETHQEMYEEDGIVIDTDETLAIIEEFAPHIYKKLTT